MLVVIHRIVGVMVLVPLLERHNSGWCFGNAELALVTSSSAIIRELCWP